MVEHSMTPPQSEFLELPPDLEELLPPLSKSWMMRLGILDMKAGSSNTLHTLDEIAQTTDLGDDLVALQRVSRQWLYKQPLEVGESGTLYRYTRFLDWTEADTAERQVKKRKFVRSGTLKNRSITTDASIIHLPLGELAELDNGTTQWASAALLLQGRSEAEEKQFLASLSPQKRPMIELTLEARACWTAARALGHGCVGHLKEKDQTITRQAQAYYTRLVGGQNVTFTSVHSEDALFAVMNGDISVTEAEKAFPTLRTHETDRIAELERVMASPVIDTADHRVAQAAVMNRHSPVWTKRSEIAVAKTWPQFPQFANEVRARADLRPIELI